MNVSRDVMASLQQAVKLHQTGQLVQAETAYKEILRGAPNNPDALNLLGLIAQSRKQHSQAVSYFDRAIKSAPHMASAYFNRGVTLSELGQHPTAIASYEAAVRIKPDYADARLNLGVLAYKAGDLVQAAHLFEEMIRFCPSDPRGFRNLGVALQDSKNFENAARAFEGAVKLNSRDSDSLAKLANCYAQQKKYDLAVRAIQQALVIEPANGEHYSNLGNWLSELDQFDAALSAHHRALEISPHRPEFLFNAANVYQAAGKPEASVEFYNKAIAANPDFVSAYVNLGEALKVLGEFDEAIVVLDKALARQSSNHVAQISKAALLGFKSMEHDVQGSEELSLNAIKPALELLDNVLRDDPENVEAKSRRAFLLHNKAKALNDLGNIDAAVNLFDQALDAGAAHLRDKEFGIRRNKSLALLAVGRYAEGWPLYRYRHDGPGIEPKPVFPFDEWRGEALHGKRLFLWTDQGVGDEIIYASMLHDLFQAYPDASYLLQCSERLVPLFARSFPNVAVIPRVDSSKVDILNFKPDYHTAVPDLGGYFRTDKSHFPQHHEYMRPDSEKSERMQSKYRELSKGRPVIGISWRSVSPDVGKYKSMSLRQWGPILSSPDFFFVSLQYGVSDAERHLAEEELNGAVYFDPEIDSLSDMDTFASQVAAMDLVVSVSNTTVHVAGALNVPTWTLVSKGRGALWYFRVGEVVPWYPSMRLVRQRQSGDWGAIIAEVANDLDAWKRSRT